MQAELDWRSRAVHSVNFLRDMEGNNVSVLDLGSRDGAALMNFAQTGRAGRLVATDIHHRIEGQVEFIEHDLEKPLPFELDSFDVVICTDVLEHVENKNQLSREIARVARRFALISLPNTQHFSYVRGLKKGRMGKQYVFDVEDGVDRHRWVTFYKSNIDFVTKHFTVSRQIDICDKPKHMRFARFWPTKYVRNQYFVCRV